MTYHNGCFSELENKSLCNKKGWEEGRRTIAVIVMSANML
jgi:hypothetical protein